MVPQITDVILPSPRNRWKSQHAWHNTQLLSWYGFLKTKDRNIAPQSSSINGIFIASVSSDASFKPYYRTWRLKRVLSRSFRLLVCCSNSLYSSHLGAVYDIFILNTVFRGKLRRTRSQAGKLHNIINTSKELRGWILVDSSLNFLIITFYWYILNSLGCKRR